ncbi:hypothetical protein KSP40_PGU015518 [Platanthera guangdongensis]|uniref:CFA20 domain-containing protein n=1 Tax=Platanthera guangdongensis TaxID=2320717 RepID=A0ABR2MNC3_9ASPA
MPLRLEDGWNNIQLNLTDLTRRAYGTNYVETLRLQVHANCRLRRVYFSDRLYSEEELPPEFKLYLPVQVLLESLSLHAAAAAADPCFQKRFVLSSQAVQHASSAGRV